MSRLIDLLRIVQAKARAWRGPILALAATFFLGALFLSMRQLDIGPDDVSLVPLIVLLLVLVPLQSLYSALNISVMGMAAKTPIRFFPALRVNVYAQLAELLPIPGGALVRAGALVQAGASPGRSAEIVLGFSLLWIACGAVGAGLALAGDLPGQVLLAGGLLAVFACTVWIAKRLGTGIAAIALGLRVIGLALVAARVLACFAAIGVPVATLAGLCFAFANILGSAAALVPAGLGVSEALAALMAKPVGVAPAAAFLAAALSRFAALLINFVLAGALAFARTRRPSLQSQP